MIKFLYPSLFIGFILYFLVKNLKEWSFKLYFLSISFLVIKDYF